MRKKFLILSALLTVVLGAVSLQSCSSDDSYTTEEYGYYTEEEIEYINDLAEQLHVNVKANPDYCGKKPSVAEIEMDLRGLASLMGNHKIDLSSSDSTNIASTRGEFGLARTKTRSSEQQVNRQGSWYGIDQSSVPNYVIDVNIQWNMDATLPSQRASGSATVHYYKGNVNEWGIGSGSLSCSLGETSITFGGSVSSSAFSKYSFSFEIVHGYLNLTTCTGEFDVVDY